MAKLTPQIITRGVDDRDVVVEKSYRDRKNDFQRLIESTGDKIPNACILVFCCIIGFVKPASLYLCLLVYLPFFLYRKNLVDHQRLPFRCPKIANREDLGDPKPGRRAFAKAEGIFFVGTDKKGMQLWLKLKDILTHMLVFGTTGSGKTVFLVSQAFNAIAFGSGFIYIDPKGSPSLAFQIFYLARKLGRDDDYRLLNFNLGDLDLKIKSPKCMSNTMNIFAPPATPDDINQMLSAMLPADNGPNSIFAQNAKTLIEGITSALCSLRDKKLIEMYPSVLTNVLSPRESDKLARNENLDPLSRTHIAKALTGLGWDEKKGFEQQGKNFAEQYSYARGYFTEITNKLTFSYSNIFNHKKGEIDLRECILQRRIAVVILPSLGKSEKENKTIGQLVLSGVKQATAVGLGKKIEGKSQDVLGALPTDSPTPFLIITDEYAAISIEGYATVLTQGRSLGIAAIVASQDYGGIKKADETGAKQIIANTKIKFFLKNEDPDDTLELIKKILGEAQVLESEGWERTDGEYIQGKRLSYKQVQRIHARDLQEQTEGEFHATLNGELVRGNSFYADPPIKDEDELRIRIMLSVLRPEPKDLEQCLEGKKNAEELISKLLNKENLNILLPENKQKLFSGIASNIKKYNGYQKIVSLILSLLSVEKENPKKEQDDFAEVLNNTSEEDMLSFETYKEESEEEEEYNKGELGLDETEGYDPEEESDGDEREEREIYMRASAGMAKREMKEFMRYPQKTDFHSEPMSHISRDTAVYDMFDVPIKTKNVDVDKIVQENIAEEIEEINTKNVAETGNKNTIQSEKKSMTNQEMLNYALLGKEDEDEDE